MKAQDLKSMDCVTEKCGLFSTKRKREERAILKVK